MRTQAVIEICPHSDGELPDELIRAAYSASIHGVIVFALLDTSPREIDSVLDDVVPLLPLRIPGVQYLDVNDRIALLEALRATDMIFARSRRFRALLTKLGIDRKAVRPLALATKVLNLGKQNSRGGRSRPRIAPRRSGEQPANPPF